MPHVVHGAACFPPGGSTLAFFFFLINGKNVSCGFRLQGSPTFQLLDECEYVFVWRTVEACPVIRAEGEARGRAPQQDSACSSSARVRHAAPVGNAQQGAMASFFSFPFFFLLLSRGLSFQSQFPYSIMLVSGTV